MNATEIVVGKMQSDSGLQMRQLLAERIGEPCKTPHRHPHIQILPLHHRSADMVRIRVASSDRGYNPRDSWWGVPRFGSVLPVVAKHFRQLREVRIQAKAHRNRALIVVEAIGCDLSSAFDAVVQVPHECGGVGAKPLSNVKRRHQLGLGINRHKDPLTAEFGGIAAADAFLFLSDPRPDFIHFQVPGYESAHSRIHEARTALSSDKQEPHDRVAIQTREPFCGANRAPLQKAVQNTLCRIGIRQKRVSRKTCVRFRKSVLAGSAFPALDVAFTEGTSLHADRVLASYTGHGLFSACVLRRKPYNRFGSGLRLTPRFGLAPQPVSAGSGALNVKRALGWRFDRDNYGLTVSKANLDSEFHAGSILPESPVSAGLSHFTQKSLPASGNTIPNRHPAIGSIRERLDLASLVEPLENRMHRRQEVFLFGNSKVLNSIPNLRGGQRNSSPPNRGLAGIGDPFDESGDSLRTFVIRSQFLQGCNDALLLCDSHLKFVSFHKQLLQLLLCFLLL